MTHFHCCRTHTHTHSYDKQFVRDYLTSINFNKKDPVALPEDVVAKTMDKYLEVYRILTGKEAQL